MSTIIWMDGLDVKRSPWMDSINQKEKNAMQDASTSELQNNLPKCKKDEKKKNWSNSTVWLTLQILFVALGEEKQRLRSPAWCPH